MPLDPRTPVLVGVGQVTSRPDPDVPLVDRPQPLDLMAAALEAAAADAAGGGAGGLLRRVGSVRVVSCLGWQAVDPAALVAGRLGIAPAETLRSAIGGNMPVSLLHDAAQALAAGQVDAVAVVGAECMYTRGAARRDPGHPVLDWAVQDAATTPAPAVFGTDRAPATELEMSRGVLLPVHAYPLFEHALRAAAGWSAEEHRRRIGELWLGFARVAADNPYAWIRQPPGTWEDVVTPSPTNRMVSTPYPKLCTANMPVDQGAGFIVCTVDAARAAGVPEERWVFPLGGADAHDHWFLSHRPELGRSPAIRLAGAAALSQSGVGVDDLAAVDLYSCFPCVVRMAAGELGLDPDDPARPLTLTGGLTFFGGPGNNYASHGICAMVERLRRQPGDAGLVTGLGWYATKHSVAVLASRPPDHGGPYRWRSVQDEVDTLPQCRVDAEATGEVTVETYTVAYDRDGAPERAILACRTPEGARAWANVVDADELAGLAATDALGAAGSLRADGMFSLA